MTRNFGTVIRGCQIFIQNIHLSIHLSAIKKPNVFNGYWKKCQMHKTVTNCVNKLQTKDKGSRTSRETVIAAGS